MISNPTEHLVSTQFSLSWLVGCEWLDASNTGRMVSLPYWHNIGISKYFVVLHSPSSVLTVLVNLLNRTVMAHTCAVSSLMPCVATRYEAALPTSQEKEARVQRAASRDTRWDGMRSCSRVSLRARCTSHSHSLRATTHSSGDTCWRKVGQRWG